MKSIPVGDLSFKLFEFYSIKNKNFSSIELDYVIHAQAKYGGPIAVTSNPDEFIMGSEANSKIMKNICIFRNDGSFLHEIPKDGLSKIVGLDFVEEEYLMVVLEDGNYLMINPHKGVSRKNEFINKPEGEKIIEAKIIDNSVIFYTEYSKDSYKFYYVSNIFTNVDCHQFKHSEFTTKPQFFLPIAPKLALSGKLECLVTDTEAGVHRLIEEEVSITLFNPKFATTKFLIELPTIKNIKLIALSSSTDAENAMIAFLAGNNTLYFISHNFEKVLMKKENVIPDSESKNQKRTMKLLWCKEDAVVLFFGKQYMIVTKDSSVTKTFPPATRGILSIQEADGIKMVSNTKCEILRVLPEYYMNIFKYTSKAKSRDLVEAYEEYENRKANYEKNILTDKKGLQEAVEQCIEAACFELDVANQIRLLKAAHFGKTFLNAGNSSFDHNRFPQACKILRVVNAFRNEKIARAITYDQFCSLTEAQVIRILIRYEVYYLADEISKFLNYSPKLISQIYTNWARAKIEAQVENYGSTEEHDQKLAQMIYEKLKDEKNISFAEIARKAVEIGKNQLAIKLLLKEKSNSKKIQVYLEMKNYALALKEALTSKDSNLIEMVVIKMARENDKSAMWNHLDKNAISRSVLINYLKNFAPADLMDFILENAKPDDKAFHLIRVAYNKDNLEERIGTFDKVCKNFKDACYLGMATEHLEYAKVLNTEGRPEMPLKNYIEDLFKSGREKEAEAYKKKFKITDRTFYTMKAKAYLRTARIQEFEALVAEKNKKNATIPWFTLVDMLIDVGQKEKIVPYAIKLPDPEEAIAILKMAQQFRAVADVASYHKRPEVLEDLLSNPGLTPEDKAYVEEVIRVPRKKL